MASTTLSTRTRWRNAGGKDAYAASDSWWRGMSAEEKQQWKNHVQKLGADWISAAESGVSPDSDMAQDLARRHVEWLRGIPGTPSAAPGGDVKATSPASGKCM